VCEEAWAAGFFDGEGSTSRRKNGTHYYPQIQIGQKDRRVLERFALMAGEGVIAEQAERCYMECLGKTFDEVRREYAA